MQDIDYKGLNTSISVYETKFLARSDYDAMLRANSLNDVLNVIKKTDYYIPEDINKTKDFDGFLMQNIREIYVELYEQTPEERIIDLNVLTYEYHNLKVLFKEWYAEKDFSQMYIKIGRHSVEELRKQVRAEDEAQNIHPVMREAINNVHSYYNEYHDFNGISVILDTAYLSHIRAISDAIDNPKVTRYVDMTIDFANLLILARGINQNRSRGTLQALLSEAGSIEIETLLELSRNKDMTRIIELYAMLPYGGQLKSRSVENKNGKIDVTELESHINAIKAEIMQEAQLNAFGPMPIISYIYFKENEITNLRLLLVGKDNDLDQENIEERMRPFYGS